MAEKKKTGTVRVRATRNVAGLPDEGSVFELERGRTVDGLIANGSLEETGEALTEAPPGGVSANAAWSGTSQDPGAVESFGSSGE